MAQLTTARRSAAEPATTVPSTRRWRMPSVAVTFVPSLVPAVTMLVVGRFRLRNPALGWDENATWMVARRTVPQILHLAGNIDGVVTPYYLFMHLWMKVFGDSELALRAPSLLCVAVGVGIAGELGRRLFGPAVGLTAGLLLTTVPQLSRYAQDARAYGLLFMFGTLATLLLYVALRRQTGSRWCWYGLSITLLGLSHIMGLLVLVGHAVAVLTHPGAGAERVHLRWLSTTTLAALPVLPLLALGIRQRHEQLGWIGDMDLSEALAAPGAVFHSPAVALLVIGLALALRWPERRVVGGLAATAVLPPALLIGASFTTSSMWVPRYVIVVLAPLCLLAAVALHRMPWRAVAAVVTAVAVSLPAHVEVRRPTAHVGLNFRTATTIITAHQRPGDGILFGRVGTWSLRAGFAYQARGRPTPADVLLHRSAADVGHLNARECADPAPCLGATTRVWYLGQRRTGDALQDLGIRNGAALRAKYRLVRVWPLDRGAVALFERAG